MISLPRGRLTTKLKPARSTFALALLTVLAACSGWDAKAPPHTNIAQPIVNVPESRIGVDIGVNLTALTHSVASTYSGKPLSEGQTDYIEIKLNLDHTTKVEKVTKIIEHPYKAAVCGLVDVPYNCLKSVTEMTTCGGFIKFPCPAIVKKPSTCLKQVEQCTKEELEVTKDVVSLVDEIRNELLPTSARLHHKLKLTGLAVGAQGTSLAVTAGLHLELSADIKQGFLDASMTVKGALACGLDTNVTAVLSTAVTTTPALAIELKDFDIEAKKICVPGAVQIVDAAFLDTSLYIQRAVLEPILHDAIVKELNKQLQKSLGNSLDFADELKVVAADAAEPLRLSDDAWLLINPTGMALSQFAGENRGGYNWLSLFVALSAKPVVVAGGKPAAGTAPGIPISLTNERTSSITLAAKGTVPLKEIETRLLAMTKELSDTKYKDLPLIISDVEVYQTGAKLTLGLTVAQRKNRQVEGKIYLSARPEFDTATGKLKLRDVAFDADSRRVIVKTAAWLLDSKIEELIADKVDIDYAGPLADLQAKYANYKESRNGITYSGALTSIKAGDIWVADDSLNVWAEATGTLTVTVSPNI